MHFGTRYRRDGVLKAEEHAARPARTRRLTDHFGRGCRRPDTAAQQDTHRGTTRAAAVGRVANNSRADRRHETREMHIDRRKSDLDVIEHVALGVRRTHLFAERRIATPVTNGRLTLDVKQ
jgi:hypothetical protein